VRFGLDRSPITSTQQGSARPSKIPVPAKRTKGSVIGKILRRGSRNRPPTERYGEHYTHHSETDLPVEPKSFQEAMHGEDADEWTKAMRAEQDALLDHNTWTLVKRPAGRNVIAGKWIYKVKLAADGSVDKYKARYVAKGFSQIEGLDYHETFAPTCKPETFRLILALAAQKQLYLGQLDVKAAYLHSPIDEEIFPEQPDGFQNGQGLVCRLNKSIYGLKQAAKNWYQELASFLLSQGFTRSRNDYCLFVKADQSGNQTYVLSWVDDLIVCGRDEQTVQQLKKDFEKKFKMDDRGELSWFLGMRIAQTSEEVTVDQEMYIHTVLKKFGMLDCKPVSTPSGGKSQANQSRE
jgi:hypothetical protein